MGIFNKSANGAKLKDSTWNVGKLDNNYPQGTIFPRLRCECGSTRFSVLKTEEYETTAKCLKCGRYHVVHGG